MFKRLYCLIFSVLIAVPVFAGENTGSIIGEVKVFRARRSADVVVYLTDVPGTFKPDQNHPTIDQKDLIFMPHVLPIVVGTTVDFANNDNVKHNIYSSSKAKKFNLGTYGSDEVSGLRQENEQLKQPEKMQIIRLVDESSVSVRQTFFELNINRSTFYKWYHRYQEGGFDALADRYRLGKSSVWFGS
ncbi:MAG: hypothetical protein CL941_05565 [Desulfobacter sp.]|nr:hypothetical protein [Desulfobacter sp.]